MGGHLFPRQILIKECQAPFKEPSPIVSNTQ